MGKETRMSFDIKNHRPHFENVQAVTTSSRNRLRIDKSWSDLRPMLHKKKNQEKAKKGIKTLPNLHCK